MSEKDPFIVTFLYRREGHKDLIIGSCKCWYPFIFHKHKGKYKRLKSPSQWLTFMQNNPGQVLCDMLSVGKFDWDTTVDAMYAILVHGTGPLVITSWEDRFRTDPLFADCQPKHKRRG